MFRIKPRIFISYSRADMEIAKTIHSALSKDYTVFFDTESIDVGEIFPERIISSIKKSDGCLVLISASSATSEWCKLEAYYAHFYNKILIPVKIGSQDYEPNSPLKNIQKNIHHVIIDNATPTDEYIKTIKKRLESTSRKSKRRVFRTISIIFLVFLLIGSFIVFGARKINTWEYNRQKKNFLSDVENSKTIYRTTEIEGFKNKFGNDRELVTKLVFMQKEPGLSDVARLNSTILSTSLLQSFAISQRQFFRNINWKLSSLSNGLLTNSTFSSGFISQSQFKNSEFDDILFNGIDSMNQGVKLSGLQFTNCSFNTVNFDGNSAIDITFMACRFRGSYINTSHFGAVNFFSDTSSTSPVITNGVLGLFENCVIENSNPPDPPGVMVLGKEEEMQFIHIVFEGCRFLGLVRPEWFRNCTFNNCIFPSQTDLSKLALNNTINDP